GIRVFHVTGVQTCALPILDVVVDELVGLLALVLPGGGQDEDGEEKGPEARAAHGLLLDDQELGAPVHLPGAFVVTGIERLALARSEGRRVGKESDSTCVPW